MKTNPNRRVVVVTGASSGVGRACARACAARGDAVALLARNVDGLEAGADEVRIAGGRATAHVVDVADAAAVEAAAAAVEAEFGRIDVWINNAMATVFAPISDTTAAEFRRVTEVTYLGYVHGTQAALRRMLPLDRGAIVQVGSALAYRSIPLQAAYCAAKAATRAFTDALRTELIHEGSNVRVSQVHLPAVNTPQSIRQRNKMPHQQQPVPPMFAPEVAADAIVRAADTGPREVLLGYPTVRAVWGQRLLPGYLERRAAHDAWESQFVEQRNDQAEDILLTTLPGDPGAHGPYRDQERGPDLLMRLGRLVGAASAAARGERRRRSITDRRPGVSAPGPAAPRGQHQV